MLQAEREAIKNNKLGCLVEDHNILWPVSLYDMVTFFALNFYSLAYWVAKLEVTASWQPPDDLVSRDQNQLDKLQVCINTMEGQCSTMGLEMSKLQIARIRSILNNGGSNAAFQLELKKLHERLFDEIGNSWMFCLSAEKERYYREPWLTFGQKIVEVFPSLSKDIEEAGKCYGAQRNTACVFHLMRIMEVGLRTLASKLAVPLTIPNWDGILNKIDTELQKRHGDKSHEWIAQQNIISEAASHLRTVKTAWRNPTMHVENKYTDEEALEIYNAVRVFMKHLATKLQDV